MRESSGRRANYFSVTFQGDWVFIRLPYELKDIEMAETILKCGELKDIPTLLGIFGEDKGEVQDEG